MHSRFAIFLLTLFFPAFAQGQAVVDCAQWRANLSNLVLSERQLFERFHQGTASAKKCEIDSKVECFDLTLESFSAQRWMCDSQTCETSSVTFATGQTAKSASLSPNGWVVSGLQTSQGVHVEKLIIADTECSWSGVRWNTVTIDKWDDEASGIRAHGLPLQTWPLGHVGLLPPALRVSSTLQELSLMAQLSSLGTDHYRKNISVISNVTPGDWFGAGIGLTTLDATGGLLWSTIEANFGQGRILAMTGELALHGEDTNRLGAHLELGSTPVWSLRRLEHNAFLQTSPLTIVGASLRGGSHELTIRTSMTDDSQMELLSIRYGTQFQSRRWISDVDVTHQIVVDERQVHSSDLGLRVGYSLFGGAVQIMPHVDILANFGVIPTESGFEASTSASLMPGLRASVPLVGKFGGLTHRMVPRAHVSAEVYGFTQRGILSPEVPEFLFTRRPGLIVGHLGVDQTVETEAFQLSFPIGAHIVFDRETERTSPYVTGRLDWQQWRLQSKLICEDVCTQIDQLATLGFVTPNSFIEIGASHGISFWGLHQAATTSLLEQWRVADPALDDGTHGHLRLRARMGDLGLESLLVSDFEEVGATGGISWNLRDLGWAWSARAGLDMNGVWTGYLGLTMVPHY